MPGPSEIRVRMHATSLNYHDLRVCSETAPSFFGRIPMADGAGIVEAVGEDVREFMPGDRVVSVFLPQWQAGNPALRHMEVIPGDTVDGYACEHVVRPATWFTHAPRGWSHAEAATLPTAAVTAWRALIEDGGLKAGRTVLLLGTGGVSIFALQIAKAMGARVIVTSSSDAKLARAADLGADHCINYRTLPNWDEQVLTLTRGEGAHHVIETVGASTLDQSIRAAHDGGHVALIGAVTGHPTQASIATVMRKQLRLQGVVVGSRHHQQAMVSGMEALGIRPITDSTYQLNDLAEGFRHEQSGRHFGKLCVVY